MVLPCFSSTAGMPPALTRVSLPSTRSQDAGELALNEVALVHDRYKVFRATFKGIVVDANALGIREFAPQIGCEHQGNIANGRKRDARSLQAQLAQRVGCCIDQRDARIERAVNEAHTAVRVIEIAPVRCACDSRACGSNQAEEQHIFGGSGVVFLLIIEPEQVEEHGACPGANGNICQDGVKRVTKPGAIEDTLDFAPKLPRLTK